MDISQLPEQKFSPLEVRVWGDYACFTRPEQKMERVTYPVPTPSAARGILEAIFWHQPMQWRVREIAVVNKGKFFSILRNEVKSVMSERAGGISITDDRSQRHTLGIRSVEYIIRADAWLLPGAKDKEGHPVDPAKYRAQFRRRVERGQCHHQPCFGCREFAAFFGEVEGHQPDTTLNENLGLMLFDIDYTNHAKGQYKPIYFQAELKNGVMKVPRYLYGEEDAS